MGKSNKYVAIFNILKMAEEINTNHHVFRGFPMFLTNVMHRKILMYLKYVMQIYFPRCVFESEIISKKQKLSISRIWPYGWGGFLLG